MPEKREFVIPTGFLKVRLQVESTVSVGSLAFVRSTIDIWSEETEFYNTIPVRIGSAEAIALQPGKYSIIAHLGALSSEKIVAEVKEGQVEELVFRFGQRDK